MQWTQIEAPETAAPPAPLTVRVQTIDARSEFPEHDHDWGQVAYAISGVLTVVAGGRSFVISPEQAVWLPAGVTHRVGSLLGAEFRSLWLARKLACPLPTAPQVFDVSPLLRALIVEAAAVADEGYEEGYGARVTELILDQLQRARVGHAGLPWPVSLPLVRLCEALYADPGDNRSVEEWGREVGMSSRTLARRFEAELGMSLRSWRRQMRLFKAVEMLGGGVSITHVAMELGYSSNSAFTYAFRSELGTSPRLYARSGAIA